mgnify:FL=1
MGMGNGGKLTQPEFTLFARNPPANKTGRLRRFFCSSTFPFPPPSLKILKKVVSRQIVFVCRTQQANQVEEFGGSFVKIMNKKTILVSAGHTNIKGLDRGAAGNWFIEGEEAVKLRDATAVYLREKPDLNITEDGFDGDNQPLTKALALAKTANRAVEYHFNAAASSAATGIEVLGKPRHKEVCQKIAGAIAEATGLKLRGEKGYKADNSGQHHRLAFCEAGGVIIEVCFISNANDMKAYKNNFEQICQNIADVLAVTKF